MVANQCSGNSFVLFRHSLRFHFKLPPAHPRTIIIIIICWSFRREGEKSRSSRGLLPMILRSYRQSMNNPRLFFQPKAFNSSSRRSIQGYALFYWECLCRARPQQAVCYLCPTVEQETGGGAARPNDRPMSSGALRALSTRSPTKTLNLRHLAVLRV